LRDLCFLAVGIGKKNQGGPAEGGRDVFGRRGWARKPIRNGFGLRWAEISGEHIRRGKPPEIVRAERAGKWGLFPKPSHVWIPRAFEQSS